MEIQLVCCHHTARLTVLFCFFFALYCCILYVNCSFYVNCWIGLEWIWMNGWMDPDSNNTIKEREKDKTKDKNKDKNNK